METFIWIWSNIREYRFKILLGLFMVLAVASLNMVNPYLAGIIVDDVIQGKQIELLSALIAIMLAVTLVKSMGKYGYHMLFEMISQNTIYKIRMKLYEKLQQLEFSFYDKNRTGDIMARMTGDLEAVRHFVAWVIYNTFEKLAIFTFAIIMLFSINYKLALILISITPLIAFFTIKLSKEVKPTFFAIREQFSKLNTVVQENISGNRVVKAFAKEDYEIEKFSLENESFKQRNLDSVKVWEKFIPILDSLAGTLSVIVILAGGIMVINGSLTLGELVMFSGFIWALNDPMRMSGWLINDYQRFSASSVKVISLLNKEPEIKNACHAVEKEDIYGRLEFRNVSFSYGDEEVLENISFKVKPGQTIAVIGPTGSGKTTLVNLICRFYDCTSGEIYVDDINIKELDLKSLRSRISVAMQDIFLFSDTIEGNIAYGAPDASMDQIQWAATKAGAHEFITSFPEGYKTIVGERGVGLSGGQKQRIALARALLKNPSILILDDTTSSVDMETEFEIQKTLNTIYREKTTFIIAHRISSVKNADVILVLDNGKIVEKGKHAELIQKRGYYHNVYSNQFGDFDNVKLISNN